MAEKIRYAGAAKPEETCQSTGCRIRGRYLFDGSRYCYGHLSKLAVAHLVVTGAVIDDPQEAYVNTKRKPGQKRKYGNE